MKLLFMMIGMWLVGIASAQAFDIETGEVLRYDIYWGPFKVGRAELEYVPEGAFDHSRNYVLKAHAKDSSSLFEMDDTWRTTGVHSDGAVFQPRKFEALQKENDYRADKQMVFDPKAKTITYTNHRDPHDVSKPLAWKGGMRDVLSALYAWRVQGLSALDHADSAEVVSVKRPFDLRKQAAAKESVRIGTEDVPVWRVDLVAQTPGKDDAESWIVRLSRDTNLTPVQVVARTKFGSFRMVLDR